MIASTASAAVAARSSARRSRSMPINAGSSCGGVRACTASLPITTPCSLAPISAPHIQNGRHSRAA
jgi:hypothetical protein